MRVLYGLWDADRPRRGLELAAERAAATGDDLVVAVLAPGDRSPGEGLVADARETLTAAGLEPDVRALSGDPAGRLVALAEREGFDRIVLGGGGRSPMGKVEIDPVVQAVLMSSSVTVTVIREP
ncbi:universal stress protein [Halobacteriales archaeon QS_8_69_26]|nr:MAG: universal stress protein [Halobacteriales archaeon QS_8_69_26]